MEKAKRSKITRILLWIASILGGIIILFGIFVYFYWRSMIKGTLEEAVQRETKGLYKADLGSIYYGIFNGNLYIRKVTITPDTTVYNALDPDSAPAILASLKIGYLTILDLGLKDALVNRRIQIRSIKVDQPELKLWRKRIPAPDTLDQTPDTTQSIPLPKGVDFISIGEIVLIAGSLSFIDQTKDTTAELNVPSIDIRVTNLWIDSTWRTDPRIYNTDDIEVVLRDIRQQTGNGMYALNFGEVAISTGGSQLSIDCFHLEPLFSRNDFSRKLGYQTDRMDIKIEKITLLSIDWKAVMLEHRFVAGKLRIDSLVLDDYRDKRVPMRPGTRPLMPQQLIRGTKSYIRIDSLEIIGGKATYTEQVFNEPGTIFFDRIDGLLTGFTNDSVFLAEKKTSPLKATAYLEGTGKLEATVNFVFGDTRNRFTLSATLSSFDLRKINPMLTKLVPVNIESGTITKLLIPNITFNDNYSTGKLTMYYNNLVFKILKENNTTWDGIKTGVMNIVANDLLINKSNPQPNGKLNSGVVYFQRDKQKSIINFIWKSILSGVKSNMGINTKEQKAIKKGKK